MILKNGLVLDGRFRFCHADLTVKEGRIEDIGPVEPAEVDEMDDLLDCSGRYIIPGLVDIHTHGCGGFDTCDNTRQAIEQMSLLQARGGVTAFLPTSMTLPEQALAAIFQTVDACARAGVPGAAIWGINMEGPFFSERKRGAQSAEHLRAPDAELFGRLQAAAGGRIRLVSVAPELPGAGAFIERLREQVGIAVGHTEADYETARAALQQGARHATHLFNAMPPFTHREPGTVGAVLDDPRATAELICDGVHIHPAVIRSAFRALGPERVVLVSDSMSATGMPDGRYTLGGEPIVVENQTARTATGALAGSTTHLMGMVRHAVEFGIPLEQAVRCASLNPARVIGAEREIGSLEVGKQADIVVLNSRLQVEKVFLRGVLLEDM